MAWNFKKELGRKFIHFLAVFILLIYFIAVDIFNRQTALLILVLILIIALELEYLRIEVGREIPILNRVWKLRRKKEKDKIGGDIFFLIGAILVLAVFNLKVAVAALLMTIFGDLAAAVIGTRFGKHYLGWLKDRAWEGILAEFFVDVLIGFLVFFWQDFSLMFNLGFWIVILGMALTATVVETLIYKMDDNLLIPVFAGFYGHMAMVIMGLI